MSIAELTPVIADIPFQLLRSVRQLPQGEFTAPALSASRSLRDVLVHLMKAEQVWVGHVILRGEKVPLWSADFISADDLQDAWEPLRKRTVQFFQDATPQQLAEVIVDEYEPHITFSVELALWHFVTHEFFHAGEISLHLGLNGIQPFVPEIIR